MKALFDTVRQLERKYIDMWQQLCVIESPTSSKEGVDAVADYCIEKAQRA